MEAALAIATLVLVLVLCLAGVTARGQSSGLAGRVDTAHLH